MTKLLVEMINDNNMLIVPDTGDVIESWRPCVASQSHFLQRCIIMGLVRHLADLADEADDAQLLESWNADDFDAFVSKHAKKKGKAKIVTSKSHKAAIEHEDKPVAVVTPMGEDSLVLNTAIEPEINMQEDEPEKGAE